MPDVIHRTHCIIKLEKKEIFLAVVEGLIETGE